MENDALVYKTAETQVLRTLFFYGKIQEYWGQISLPPLHY